MRILLYSLYSKLEASFVLSLSSYTYLREAFKKIKSVEIFHTFLQPHPRKKYCPKNILFSIFLKASLIFIYSVKNNHDLITIKIEKKKSFCS